MTCSRAFLAIAGVVLAAWLGAARGDDADVLQSYGKRPVLSRLTIWDGKRFAGGGSWTTEGGRCARTDAEGHLTKTSIQYHTEGSRWMGCGYNFFTWYPPESGYDLTNYEFFSFWIKVQAAPGQGPNGLSVTLSCSATRKNSQSLALADYCKGYDDGQWHEVVIPVKHFAKEGFDPATAWEIDLGQSSPDARNFNVFVAEVAAENRERP